MEWRSPAEKITEGQVVVDATLNVHCVTYLTNYSAGRSGAVLTLKGWKTYRLRHGVVDGTLWDVL